MRNDLNLSVTLCILRSLVHFQNLLNMEWKYKAKPTKVPVITHLELPQNAVIISSIERPSTNLPHICPVQHLRTMCCIGIKEVLY